MTATEQQTPPPQTTPSWQQVYDQFVRPHMRPEDDGKFVAIDQLTGEYELDANEIPAVLRLRGRLPEAKVLLLCVGQPYTYRI